MTQEDRAKSGMLTLERAFDVLEVFSDEFPRLSLLDISRRLKLPKSSVFRYLAVLERREYVEREADGRYSLGTKFLYMGNLVRSQLRIVDIALPVMDELRSTHRETVNLGVLDRGEVTHIEVLEGLFSIKTTSPVGSRAPTHSTGLGKAILAFSDPAVLPGVIERHGLRALTERTLTTRSALLAHLEEVRARGYATDDGESEHGMYCIAAPIFDGTDQVIAAISVSGPELRMKSETDLLAQDVVRAAAQISQRLGSSEADGGRVSGYSTAGS